MNMLKLYNEIEDENAIASGILCIGVTMVMLKGGEEIDECEIMDVCPLRWLELWYDVNIGENLSKEQRGEVKIFLQKQKARRVLPGHTV